MTKRVYISQVSTYKEAVAKNYFYNRTLEVQEIDLGIAMPYNDGYNQNIYGGVYKNGSLEVVAGMDSEKPYENFYPNKIENLTYIDESVILCGNHHVHFGHILLIAISRLWYIIQNPQDKRKVIFIGCEIYGKWGESATLTKECYCEFLKLFGIDENRIIFIEKPTQFKHITCPEESLNHNRWEVEGLGYTKEYPLIYCTFAKNANKLCAKEQTFNKIYLSHSKWGHRPEQHFLNEQIYEEFFKNRGYAIIYPEEFSITKMAYLMSNAKEVATTMGTTAHFALLCKPNTTFIVLTRECNSFPPLEIQCLIHQAMNLNWFIVNANHNYLPSFFQNSGWGVANFAFTNDFKEFCEDYFKGNFSNEFSQKVDDLAYFKAFTKFYSNSKYYKMFLANLTPFDFVNKMSEVFYGITLDKNDFVENISDTNKKRKEKWYKRLWRHLKTMKF